MATTSTVDQQVSDKQNSKNEEDARTKMGRHVVYFALAIIGLLGLGACAAAFYVPNDCADCDVETLKQRFTMVKEVLSMLLPVLGTWVGTVLAFYFSKENFKAAAEQTSQLVDQINSQQKKLQETLVTKVMLALSATDIVKLIFTQTETDEYLKSINIKRDIIAELFNKSGRYRLPILDADSKPKYMIHRSIIDKFIAEQALTENPVNAIKVEDLSLYDLFQNDHYKKIATAFGTVKMDDNLTTVKSKMDNNPDCSDVFVTEDGSLNSRAIGWITNAILVEQSKV